MYVWFDALNIYQSGVGFSFDEKQYKKWWPANLHVIGKGIIRFHGVYWPAFLLSAGLHLPKALFVHGYFTVNGQKMSKTLGNVADPLEFVKKYGADALRYYLLKEISPFQDGDFSEKKLLQIYSSELVNELGNLVSRVAKLVQDKNLDPKQLREERKNALWEEVDHLLNDFRFNEALELIWGNIRGINQYLNRERPWQENLSEDNKRLSVVVVLSHSVTSLLEIAEALEPFLPETSTKIKNQFLVNEIKNIAHIFEKKVRNIRVKN